MGKYENTKKGESNKITKITTPSVFGSHKSMVVEELDNGWVLCEDDYGKYKTRKSRLDDGLADPHRFSRSVFSGVSQNNA